MSGVQAVVCAAPGETPGNVAIWVKMPLCATRPKKLTVKDALSESVPVAESVTDVAVPLAASAGALSATTGALPLPPPLNGAPAVQVAPPVRVPDGAPATLEAALVPEPSLRP